MKPNKQNPFNAERITPNVMDPQCPSRRLLTLLADKWVLLVIYALQHDKKRTSQIKYILQDVSQKMLTQTLRKLEANNIVKRTVYQQVPPKVEYELTELGRSLVDPVRMICDWAQENFSEAQEAESISAD